MTDNLSQTNHRRAASGGARSIVRVFGAILWPSFFAAGVSAMVFFAIVDPLELADITWPHVAVSRQVGYTIGFFMFWGCTLASSAFSALLLGHLSAPGQRNATTGPDMGP